MSNPIDEFRSVHSRLEKAQARVAELEAAIQEHQRQTEGSIGGGVTTWAVDKALWAKLDKEGVE